MNSELDMKGFSPRNLKYMRRFDDIRPDAGFVQQVAAQLPWFHLRPAGQSCRGGTRGEPLTLSGRSIAGYTLCLAIKSPAGSLLIPGSSGAGTSPFTIFCLPPDSM